MTSTLPIGRRVREARNRAGLTQAQLAAEAGMERSSLAKVESGARRVTAVELARIASALDERIEWFVDQAPAPIVARRNAAGGDVAAPAIDRCVERVARHVEFVAGHAARFELPPSPAMPRPTSAEATEAAARRFRRDRGLDDAAPLLDIARVAESAGLLTFSLDLTEETADGASIMLDHGGVAVVNGRRHVGRRRLTAAHELAHFVFADEYTIDWRVGETDTDQWESRVERFARAILLPRSALAERFTSGLSTADLRSVAVRAASEFRVDMSTLARRLLELRLVSASEADRVRQFQTTQADIVEMNLVVADELSAPELPRTYERAVLALYRSETVSTERALDLLLDTWDEDQLPELPVRSPDSIWSFVS